MSSANSIPNVSQDRPTLGIALMLAFCVLAPVGDGMAKLLGGTVPVLQIVLARFGAQLVIFLPLAVFLGEDLRVPRRHWGRILLRTALHIAGIWLMFTALLYLPLADAIAIAFVMPFIMLLLGAIVLGEAVGPRRMVACAVGFVGTLLVMQPAFQDVGWPATLPLAVAVIFALFMLVTRQIAQEVPAVTLQAWSGGIATTLLLPLTAFAEAFGISMLPLASLAPSDLTLLILLGIVGAVAHLAMTWSLRFAPSATLAPMQYLEIPFAAIVGWLFFADWPNGLAALGIAVILGAGLFIIWCERRAEPAP